MSLLGIISVYLQRPADQDEKYAAYKARNNTKRYIISGFHGEANEKKKSTIAYKKVSPSTLSRR